MTPPGQGHSGVMRVSVVRSGGFAGRTTEMVLDSSALPEEEQAALRETVQRARPLQGAADPATGGADRFTYRIGVQDDDGEQEVQLGEAALTPELKAVVDLVQSSPQREHRVLPLS